MVSIVGLPNPCRRNEAAAASGNGALMMETERRLRLSIKNEPINKPWEGCDAWF
jgi:hypothetical protein